MLSPDYFYSDTKHSFLLSSAIIAVCSGEAAINYQHSTVANIPCQYSSSSTMYNGSECPRKCFRGNVSTLLVEFIYKKHLLCKRHKTK